MFTLSEDVAAVGVQAKWIDHLVSCGLRAARYASKLEDKQLVLALSVPQRDYAAALIACGWVLGAKRPNVSDPRRVLERVEPGQKVCLTDKKHIVAAKFFRVETKRGREVLVTDQSTWSIDKITAINVLSDDMEPTKIPCCQESPEPGSLARMAGIDRNWDSWLVSAPADLAIIGTCKWIERELDACIFRSEDIALDSDDIKTVLLPRKKGAVAWHTRIVSHVDRDACLNLPDSTSIVILDGNGAIKYLPDLRSKVVICILDRSAANETAEESILQHRNTRGVPISLSEVNGWKMLPGIEYIAYEVSL